MAHTLVIGLAQNAVIKNTLRYLPEIITNCYNGSNSFKQLITICHKGVLLVCQNLKVT